jgi:hypothetical protein
MAIFKQYETSADYIIVDTVFFLCAGRLQTKKNGRPV